MTWPLLIELFLHMVMGSTDTFMLAHVSDQAVAAVGVANQVIFMTIIMFGFVATGTSVVIAQYIGAKRYKEASQVSAISISLNILFGIVVSALIVVYREEILLAFHLAPRLLEYANIYLWIVGGSLVIEAVLVTTSAIVRSNGNTLEAMFVSLGMNILHVVGNYLFIYGPLGIPRLGVTGVAISTAVSRLIALIVIFVIMYRRLQVPIQLKDYLSMKLGFIKQILKVGLPSAGEQLSYQTSQILITMFITMIGTAALATRIYTFNIISFIALFGLAVGQGTQIIVGHLIGAGLKEEAYGKLLRSLKWSLLVTMIVVLTAALNRKTLIGIFTEDPVIVNLGASLLLLGIILEPGRTFNLVIISSLRAAGDVQFPILMGILSMWGISVPLAYYLGIHLHYGLLGIWTAFVVDEWLRGIFMYLRWRSRIWEKKVLVQTESARSS